MRLAPTEGDITSTLLFYLDFFPSLVPAWRPFVEHARLPALELFLTETAEELQRKVDEETNLPLIAIE